MTSNYTFRDETVKFDIIPVSKTSGRFVNGDYFPLPYSIETEKRILKYLEMDYLSSDQVIQKVNDLTPEELNQLHYLLLSIESYYQSNNPVIPRHVLIYLLVTNEGLKTLKRIKFKSFLLSNGGSLCEKPDWFESIPYYHSYDIGDIFNYAFGFFFEEKDESDFLLSQEPVLTDPYYVKSFKKITRRMILGSSDFQEVLPQEILFRVSSSSSIDEAMNSFPNYHLKSNHLQFSDVRSAGKRVFITTGPGSGRDAIINKIEDLNTVQLLNENIREFLKENFSHSLLLGPLEKQRKKYFKRCQKHPFFYCRDIRKEGITKPKYLCEIIISALNERFPDCLAFKSPYFYSGPWFEGDKGERGHGLGMANELTTLMQLMLLYTTNYLIGKGGDYVSSTKALFLNDDSIIYIDGTEDDLDTFVDYDFNLCQGLGIMVQKDKSFQSSSAAIFCEMYYSRGKPFVNDKISYGIRELNVIRRCTNILEAKFYAGNMKGSLSFIEDTLKKTYITLGYEFHKDEINWPMTLGGLRPFKLLGVDCTLRYVESYSDIKILYRAFTANKEIKLCRWNKYLKEYIPPIFKTYPLLLKVKDERILEKLGMGTMQSLSSTFFRPTKEHKFFWSLEKLFRKRQKIFNKVTTSPTFDSFCELYTQESLSNVCLNEKFIERFIPVKIISVKKFKDPYLVKNPMLSYINTISVINHTIPKTSWGLFQQNCVLSHEKSVFARARAQNTLSLIDRFEEDFETDFIVFPENPDDIDDFMESYPKPFLTYQLVKLGNQLPIPKINFRNPDLKLRKEVYGKYLSLREIYLSQTFKWNMMSFILRFENDYKDMIEFDNDFWWDVKQTAEEKIEEAVPQRETVSENEREMYNVPMALDTSGVTFLDPVDRPEPKLEESESSSSSGDLIDFSESKPEASYSTGNMFLKENGPLPEGDISVYGSQDWLIWFFNQNSIVQDNCMEADAELAYASYDTMAFQRGVMPGSDAFKERNENLENNMIHSANLSWVAYVFHYVFRNIKPPEDDPFDAGDLFG